MNRHVSVVIPTYQRAALVGDAVRTALAQRDVDVEVLVVDDGSTDGTAAAVAAAADDRVRYLPQARNRGLCATRNAGVAAARAPWLAFLDDDDGWRPGKLAAQLDALAAAPGARWCVAAAVATDGDLVPFLVQPVPPAEQVAGDLRRRNCVPGGGSGVVAERRLVQELGGFDERLHHVGDWDLWLRLAATGPPAVVDEPLLAYRRHGARMSADVGGIAEEVRELARRGLVDADVPATWLAVPDADGAADPADPRAARRLGRALLARQGAGVASVAEQVVAEVRAAGRG